MAYIITIVIYLIVLVPIGAILAFRVKSQEDFMVAGRKLTAGMLSVAYLDVINGILILVGVFLALPFLINHVGGMEYIVNDVPPRKHAVLGNMTAIKAMGYFVPTLL
jgi:Na+/proline symporter